MFWKYLERIVNENSIVIDRPKGTRHPKYRDIVYETDYGYIKNTKSMDGGGIDIFMGSEKDKNIDTIICVIDLLKKDSEIKILLGCTEDEKIKVHEFLKAILVRREEV